MSTFAAVDLGASSGRSAGVLGGGLAELRGLLRTTQDLRLHRPTPGAEAAWVAAEERTGGR